MPRKKRKNGNKVLTGLIVAAIVVVAAFFIYRILEFRKPEFVRYPEFGIAIPQDYLIHGIDVSRYQQSIAWDEVKSMQVQHIKLGFSFIKATEGIGKVDPQFKRNWRRSKQAGMIRGAYHFFLATKDGKKQAENFIKAVKIEPGDLPPVLDVEQTYGVSKKVLQAEVKEWLQVVEEYYGVRPIIYTNVDFYKRQLDKGFEDYHLWVAHYFQANKPRIARNWTFWQHSEEGRVNGILSRVDFNVFNGDSVAFKALLVK